MTLASSAAPPNSLRMWTDGARIYVELPGRLGPYITAYEYSEGGLGKALALLGQHRVDYDYSGTVPVAYARRFDPSKLQPGTAPQRAIAEKLLRRRGLIK